MARWFALAMLLASAFGLSGCGYNTLQQQDEQIKAAWSEVVNQYQRRADLIPNLVNTVKGYAQQEKDVLIGVTEALAGLLFAPSAKSMFAFAILVGVLLFRPQGILGKRAS